MGSITKVFISLSKAIRSMFLTRYHPERHYMRGPGPACARRQGSSNSAHA